MRSGKPTCWLLLEMGDETVKIEIFEKPPQLLLFDQLRQRYDQRLSLPVSQLGEVGDLNHRDLVREGRRGGRSSTGCSHVRWATAPLPLQATLLEVRRGGRLTCG